MIINEAILFKVSMSTSIILYFHMEKCIINILTLRTCNLENPKYCDRTFL